MKRLFQKPTPIGLGIQPDAVRLVQLSKLKNTYIVEMAVEKPLPSGLLVEGKIKQFDVLRIILQELVQQHHLKGRTTVICLPANLVRMQRMQVPRGLSEMEVELEIDTRIQSQFPGLNEELCVDFTLLPAVAEESVDVFFAVARKEYLSQYTECVQAAGLAVKIVDVDIYALKRAVCFYHNTQAILYIHQTTATFIAFDAQEIYFYQSWEIVDPNHLVTQLKQCMELCATTFPSLTLQKLMVCAPAYLDVLLNAQTELACSIQTPHGLEAKFLIAYGLAMREMSLW